RTEQEPTSCVSASCTTLPPPAGVPADSDWRGRVPVLIQSTREFSRQRLTDRRDVPAYTYAQAAMALRLPVSTLRAWTHGQNYTPPRGERKRFEPLISLPPYEYEPGLSYNNLIEAFALRALRTRHHIDMRQVR